MPTLEELQKAETMPLEELRQLALKEAEDAAAAPAPKPEQKRDEQGKFAKQEEELDNSADAQPEDAEVVDGEPTKTIYRKEIENGEGSIDVYEADSLESLVDKIAEGKKNANKKIQEFIKEKRLAVAQTEQVSKDDEYLIQQKLKDSPKKTIREVVNEVIEERLAKEQRSNEVQSQFVQTHPDYFATPENGRKLAAEVKLSGASEFTSEGLEKAYQSLRRSGLLQLKPKVADDATAAEPKDTQQTVEPKVDATQQRSPKKGSTISARGAVKAVTPNAAPTEDELYKMPMEDLKKLANKQLAGNQE
jgi:hypothetical protein